MTHLNIRWLCLPILSLVVSSFSGCRSLPTLDLAEELAYPPAESPLWTELSQTRSGDWAYLLNTGEEAIAWRLRAIDSATQSIDLQTFLWFEDQTGLAVLHHLFLAAERGVRVRILLDDTFTGAYENAIWQIDHHPNIEFRLYNPYANRTENIALRMLLNLGDFERLDHRTHNKCLIVDNRVAIVGGRNQADEYFGWHEQANFRDLELICHGQVVPRLSRLYDTFWNGDWTYPEEFVTHPHNLKESPEGFAKWVAANTQKLFHEDAEEQSSQWQTLAAQAFPAKLQVLADLPLAGKSNHTDSSGSTILEKELIELIDQAQQELVMVSAYLIPTPALTDAVLRAEQRGVSVKILTNSMRSNNHLAAHSAYHHHTRALLKSGADVHEVNIFADDRSLYMNEPIEEKHLGLHGKFMLIDHDYSIIGSANLDPRSLILNTELNLAVQSKELNKQLREYIEVDFQLNNAWKLQLGEDGQLEWVSENETLTKQPHYSKMQLIENWILSALPIENKM